jgi:hypothetical protein
MCHPRIANPPMQKFLFASPEAEATVEGSKQSFYVALGSPIIGDTVQLMFTHDWGRVTE